MNLAVEGAALLGQAQTDLAQDQRPPMIVEIVKDLAH
jgi:hypothetical protein